MFVNPKFLGQVPSFFVDLGSPPSMGLIPLGDSKWPLEVKNRMAALFRAKGFEDPMNEIMVSPTANGFGGLDNADWDQVLITYDYASERDLEKRSRIEQKMTRTRGAMCVV